MPEFNPQQLLSQLSDFHDARQPEALAPYLQFYGIDFRSQDIHQHLGLLQLAGYRIAVQRLRPSAPAGRVLVLHGYLDHQGLYGSLISYLLGQRLEVICIDLPGHGLSSGPRAAIGDFNEYQLILEGLIDRLSLADPEIPLHLLGQSTGCAIINQFLLQQQPDFIASIVELAPLVRASHWRQIRLLEKVVSSFIKEVPRVLIENSHDDVFLNLVKNDPLQSPVVSAEWLRALIRWLPQFLALPASSKYRPLIVQGQEDDTVDWRYNLDVLQRKFPQQQCLMLSEGRHQLANESLPIRQQIYRWLDQQQAWQGAGSRPASPEGTC